MKDWRADLLEWYRANRRDLPWRRSQNPYAIWVSEIMLQQTQVAAVIPYYERWMRQFPTVESLAAAELDQALALWSGLGYYKRCRFLHAGARYVVAHGMPTTASDWRRVPGVGRYTAGAIMSIALGEPAALVDGNVERVYARLYASPATGDRLASEAWKWAEASIDPVGPGDWNQALMELGATVCTPLRPRCGECPLSGICQGSETPGAFPAPEPKRSTAVLERTMVIPVCEGKVGLRRIPAGQWWEGMWEFPWVEGTVAPPDVVLLRRIRHTVTHHRISLWVYRQPLRVQDAHLTWFSPEEAATLALPAPVRRALLLHREQK